MRLLKTYFFALASHAVRRFWRQGSGITVILALLVRPTFAGAVVVAAALSGFYADTLAKGAGADVRALISTSYFQAVLGLLALTAMLPERSRLNLEPYRYLPLSRFGVAAADVAIGTLRLPLIFFVAFGSGLALGGAIPRPATWFAATAAIAITACLFGGALHRALRTRPWRFLATVVGACMFALVDLALKADLIATASVAWSDALYGGARWCLLLAWAGAAGAFYVTTRSRADEMQFPAARSVRRRMSLLSLTRKPVLRLAVIEIHMLRRCSYPRYQFRAITLLLIVIVGLMIVGPDDAYGFITMLFAVAGLAISYAQLALAWNGDHFDGLFALPFNAGQHVQARWLIGAVLASISAVAMFGLLIVTDIGSPMTLLACYLLTLGWLIAPLIAMSMQWSRPVSLGGTAIGNLKAYSWHLYAVAFGLWVGSHVLITWTTPRTATIAFLGLGIVGMLIQPPVLRRIANDLDACLPELAERMRAKV